MKESLGVDLGNVIIDHLGFGTTPEFFQFGDYNIIPPVPGAFKALERLNREKFGSNIFVVYNASDIADQKITSWLKSHNFFERTGIAQERVRRTQNGRNKLSVCESYDCSHFIDDRLEVLGHLMDKVSDLYLFRPQAEEVEKHKDFLGRVQQVASWADVVERLLI